MRLWSSAISSSSKARRDSLHFISFRAQTPKSPKPGSRMKQLRSQRHYAETEGLREMQEGRFSSHSRLPHRKLQHGSSMVPGRCRTCNLFPGSSSTSSSSSKGTGTCLLISRLKPGTLKAQFEVPFWSLLWSVGAFEMCASLGLFWCSYVQVMRREGL